MLNVFLLPADDSVCLGDEVAGELECGCGEAAVDGADGLSHCV